MSVAKFFFFLHFKVFGTQRLLAAAAEEDTSLSNPSDPERMSKGRKSRKEEMKGAENGNSREETTE